MLLLIGSLVSTTSTAADIYEHHFKDSSDSPALKRNHSLPESFDVSWASIGAGAATGKHDGPLVLMASSYMFKNQLYGTTRFIWSQDLHKSTQEKEQFTYFEFGQLFGRKYIHKGDDIFWAIGLSWVTGNDKSNNRLDFKTIGIAWEIETHLARFFIFGGSAKLIGNVNHQHSMVGLSFQFNLGDF